MKTLAVLACGLFLLVLFSEAVIEVFYQKSIRNAEANSIPTAILVLGATPNSSRMMTRLIRARETALKFPQAQIILSGNESMGEVSFMEKGLNKLGLQGPFVEETLSSTTFENIRNSKSLSKGPFVIVTNDFHVRRAYAFAAKLGAPVVFGKFDPDTSPSFGLFLRERIACIKGAFQILM